MIKIGEQERLNGKSTAKLSIYLFQNKVYTAWPSYSTNLSKQLKFLQTGRTNSGQQGTCHNAHFAGTPCEQIKPYHPLASVQKYAKARKKDKCRARQREREGDRQKQRETKTERHRSG